ncbi:cytochrome d ubiquinol oxidase subunit II [Chitinophagaceae bacterium LB-8]|uniref:Cytochrome d ubiquinol oxidase subunit II n=1 Tax=Paraflavisolibacter caeni TaxID=2982496 RepID=A0A9X2XWT6_9BACT|nr:cytochrome d ubiquinol oxidase subunit II [Paraflavisolibacter caeni]MCU7550530.1 cytochrome d ubiquinol oxidase subunit II [Paraflavisolibacter caeni]
MKRAPFLLFLIAILSLISGYLLSKASWVGKAGISMFYREYQFLKVWWQGALAVFGVLFLLFLIQGTVQRKAARGRANLIHIICILLALTGLYFTYNDFRHDLSHRLLGERFHLGAYLFWVGWMMVSLFYMAQKKAVKRIAAI